MTARKPLLCLDRAPRVRVHYNEPNLGDTSAMDWRYVFGSSGEKFEIKPGDSRNAIPIVPV